MDLRAFIVSFISFEFVICAPISEDQINAECAKVRLELKNIEPAKVEDELFRKAAIARIEKEEQVDKHKLDMKKLGDELGQLRNEKKIADQKVLVRDAAVGYRSRLEKLEKLIFPDWLLNTNLNRFQRFLLALTIHTTKYSAILKNKLLACGITPYDFALAVDDFYDDSSKRFTHFGRIRIPKTDEEWEQLYDYFGATDEYEKITLRISLEELPLPTTTEQGDGKTVGNRYFILLENVDFAAGENDVKKLFKSIIDDDGITRIHIVKKYKDLKTGYVAVDFISKKYKTVDEIRTNLRACKKFPFGRPYFDAKIYTESGDKADDNPTSTQVTVETKILVSTQTA